MILLPSHILEHHAPHYSVHDVPNLSTTAPDDAADDPDPDPLALDIAADVPLPVQEQDGVRLLVLHAAPRPNFHVPLQFLSSAILSLAHSHLHHHSLQHSPPRPTAHLLQLLFIHVLGSPGGIGLLRNRRGTTTTTPMTVGVNGNPLMVPQSLFPHRLLHHLSKMTLDKMKCPCPP